MSEGHAGPGWQLAPALRQPARVLLLADCPSPHWPETGCDPMMVLIGESFCKIPGRRIANPRMTRLLGWTTGQYLAFADRANAGGSRDAAVEVLRRSEAPVVLALGRLAAAAIGLGGESLMPPTLGWPGLPDGSVRFVVTMPHPSGRCRLWNRDIKLEAGALVQPESRAKAAIARVLWWASESAFMQKYGIRGLSGLLQQTGSSHNTTGESAVDLSLRAGGP